MGAGVTIAGMATEVLPCAYCGRDLVLVDTEIGWSLPNVAELLRIHAACFAAAEAEGGEDDMYGESAVG